MTNITPRLLKAFEIAAAFLQREINKRLRLNPDANPADVWAAVTFDGRILIGTSLLHEGQGFYVDQHGRWEEV